MDHHGDADGDGFIEYGRRSRDGLVQQGWKDSADSVFHRDGTLADGPIAICEVQGYAYAARIGMARLARALGQEALADQQQGIAKKLQVSFDSAYWCDELSAFALALDGKKLPCRVRSSNAGHCLYTGISLPERAERMAKLLSSPEMFSGWGIRTLSTAEQRYNPMSYHNGSIWPHDNAIVAAGLARYGFKQEAVKVLAALFDASLFVDLHRLPELFCGFERRESEGPTLYPVACSPQAWASAAPFLLLEAVLGLRIDAAQGRVTFEYPMLPTFLDDVLITNLRVGSARVDLRLHRYPDDVGINVLRKTGQVEVVLVK
jgi:glycogen debranching enzyme